MQYLSLITVLLFTAVLGLAQEAYLEPWKDVNFTQQLEIEKLVGRTPPRARKRQPNLIEGVKLRPQRGALFGLPEAGAEASPAREATQLSAPPHHLDGFLAIPDDNTAVPPDCAGAVSPDHVVTALNTEIRVQDRQGKDLRTLSEERFFATLGPFESGLFDPRVVYDANAKRWIVIILADAGGRTPALLVAVSRTSDPLGDWRMTRLLNPAAVGLDFDYPTMAIGGKLLLVSVSVYRGLSYQSTLNTAFVLQDLYNASTSLRQFEDFFGTNTPVADPNPDNNRGLFVNVAIGVFDASLRLIFREVNLTGPGNITVADRTQAMAGDLDPEYSGLIMPQRGSDVLIDGGDVSLQNCTARGTDAWCVGTNFLRFGTQRTALVQLYIINWIPAPGSPTVGRVRIDDPTYQSFYGYPSVAVNKNKDIFIGYNRFRKDEFATARFAFRRATDAPGAFYHDALVKAGEDSYTKGGLRVRWGDYSTTVVDPVDDTSFWTLQEYAASRTESGNSQWGTWWTRFRQRNSTCQYRLDRNSADLASAGGPLRITLTTVPSDCSWQVAPNASWVRVLSQPAALGSGNFEFQVALNRQAAARTATITIGDQTFTVNQAANATPPPQEPLLTVTKFEAPVTARVGDSVSLSAVVRNTGTRGAGTFRVGFYLAQRSSVTNKDIFTGYGCVVNQGLIADEVTTCAGSFQVPADLTPGAYSIAAIADDREQVTMSDRTAATRLSDAGAFTIQASPNAPSAATAGLVNGASAKTGPLAPGAIFVLYGARLGPAALTTLTLDAQGRVATTLAGTRILFDGVAAPLIYTSGGQLSGIVPYAVAGKANVSLVPEYNGVRGNPVTVAVASAAPAFFTVDFSGQNQVAALNENGSVNSAANPAEAGRLIVLYGTGGGTFRTQPVDGAVIGAPLPEFLAPLSVTIGGLEAETLYAGPAPGLVSGVVQINARIPAGVAPGDRVAVVVRSGVGSAQIVSPAGTTIAVR